MYTEYSERKQTLTYLNAGTEELNKVLKGVCSVHGLGHESDKCSELTATKTVVCRLLRFLLHLFLGYKDMK